VHFVSLAKMEAGKLDPRLSTLAHSFNLVTKLVTEPHQPL
jgi:hypothetical protein